MSGAWIDLAYLVAAVLFILGLKGLTHPRTAVRGNLLGATGMLVAVVVTLFSAGVISYTLIVVGLVMGAIIGAILAIKVEMTEMPELVALFNGLGGAASFVVAGALLPDVAENVTTDSAIATAITGLIGAVTLTGSLVAFAKLRGLEILDKIPKTPAQPYINIAWTVLAVLLCVVAVLNPASGWLYALLVLVALVLGVGLVVGIGGADMPVVIALLNSFSGLAAAGTGFVLANNVLIVAGSLVGASGLILTKIMCKAMNRSLVSVLFGKLGPKADGPSADEVYTNVKSTSADEVAMLLEVASRVVIVPGYGMAVAQAQHAVRDLTDYLQEHDVEVEFGIHPVAGRMPGHMNVLLAEADIPYDLLKEMDDINTTLAQTDVCLIVGANDTVNPDARTNPDSPIAGMPIIDVDKARTAVVIKRSLSPGFAQIPNPLFSMDNTLMLFGDGKDAVLDILAALKEG